MKAGNSKKEQNVFDLIDNLTAEEDTTPWEGTLRDYLPLVIENPTLNESAHARIWRMIESAGVEFEEDDVKKKNPRYKFFENDLFGVDETLAKLMVDYFKPAAAGSDVARRILLLWGPTSSGKSQFSILLKRGLEQFSRTKEGAVYALSDSPMYENPLVVIPHQVRGQLRDKYGLNIEGDPSPAITYLLENKYDGDFWKLPVKRVFLSEQNRVGIGTFQPGDTKCLVGDSLVLCEHGLIPIQDLEASTTKVRLADGKLKEHTNFFHYNSRQVRNIKTNLGYSVSGTLNHPLMTVSSGGDFTWKVMEDIGVGDTLVLAKGHGIDFAKQELIENPLNLKWSSTTAQFLGIYVAEGRINGKYNVEISNCAEPIHTIIKSFCSDYDLNFTEYENRVIVYGKKLVDTLRLIGFTSGAHAKCIPQCVFTSGYVKEFLLGLWLGDGNIGCHSSKNTNEAIYSTVSATLAEQVHALLLALGIPAKKGFDPEVGTSGAFRILVSGSRVRQLADQLNLPEWKFTRPLVEVESNENLYLMPNVDELAKDICKSGSGMSKWHRYTVSTKSYGRRFSEKSIHDFISEATDCECDSKLIEKMECVGSKDYLYAQVTSISEDVRDVYDIEVPQFHYFIANGFISHNSQSQSELVGSVNFAKLEDYGVESHPMAYNFDGELNVANRGMMEFIEMLKVDPKFRHILLTLAQEKQIKVERFPLIYADLVPIAHSVVGDTPIPYKKDGVVRFDSIESLTDNNDTSIEVLATDVGSNPVWTKVKGFHKHQFTGRLVKTIQKNGVTDTTWNHSLIGKDCNPFYPDDKKDVLAFRSVPNIEEVSEFCLPYPESLQEVEGRLYVKPTGNKKVDGEYGKYSVQGKYDAGSVSARDIVKVMCWFATEGHVNNAHAIISQNDVATLDNIKVAAENISTAKASLQDRSDRKDGTSRLHLSARVWREILQYSCGKYSENKRLPDFIFSLPYGLRKYALDQLVLGDGSTKVDFSCSEEYRDEYFRFKTTSKMLAAQVSFLAASLDKDFNVYFGYTKSGKPYYGLRFRKNEREGFGTNQTEEVEVEDLTVYDIECHGNHSFTGGVGNVVHHNTNETEYNKFLAKKEEEALHDRLLVRKFPYNLRLDDEVRIYEKLICNTPGFQGVHIAPHTLKIAAMFAVLSRLEEPKNKAVTVLQKMHLYNGEVVEGLKQEDVKDLRKDSSREGLDGVSPRYIVNRLAACFSRHGVTSITPIDALRSIKDGFDSNAKLNEDSIKELENVISLCVEEYNKVACNEVQKAFFVNFENEVSNLLENYIDNVGAYLNKDKVENEWGDFEEPNERLMRNVEEQVKITETGKESFREEVYRKVLEEKSKTGEFNYQTHPKLKEALQKQLFEERSDVIRLTVTTRNPDPEGLKKVNEVAKALIEKFGYNAESANELLRYVSSIMSKSS